MLPILTFYDVANFGPRNSEIQSNTHGAIWPSLPKNRSFSYFCNIFLGQNGPSGFLANCKSFFRNAIQRVIVRSSRKKVIFANACRGVAVVAYKRLILRYFSVLKDIRVPVGKCPFTEDIKLSVTALRYCSFPNPTTVSLLNSFPKRNFNVFFRPITIPGTNILIFMSWVKWIRADWTNFLEGIRIVLHRDDILVNHGAEARKLELRGLFLIGYQMLKTCQYP